MGAVRSTEKSDPPEHSCSAPTSTSSDGAPDESRVLTEDRPTTLDTQQASWAAMMDNRQLSIFERLERKKNQTSTPAVDDKRESLHAASPASNLPVARTVQRVAPRVASNTPTTWFPGIVSRIDSFLDYYLHPASAEQSQPGMPNDEDHTSSSSEPEESESAAEPMYEDAPVDEAAATLSLDMFLGSPDSEPTSCLESEYESAEEQICDDGYMGEPAVTSSADMFIGWPESESEEETLADRPPTTSSPDITLCASESESAEKEMYAEEYADEPIITSSLDVSFISPASFSSPESESAEEDVDEDESTDEPTTTPSPDMSLVLNNHDTIVQPKPTDLELVLVPPSALDAPSNAIHSDHTPIPPSHVVVTGCPEQHTSEDRPSECLDLNPASQSETSQLPQNIVDTIRDMAEALGALNLHSKVKPSKQPKEPRKLFELPQELIDIIFNMAYPSEDISQYVEKHIWDKRETSKMRESSATYFKRPFCPKVNDFLVSKAFYYAASHAWVSNQHFYDTHTSKERRYGAFQFLKSTFFDSSHPSILVKFCTKMSVQLCPLCRFHTLPRLRELSIQVNEETFESSEPRFAWDFALTPQELEAIVTKTKLDKLSGLAKFSMSPGDVSYAKTPAQKQQFAENLQALEALVKPIATRPRATTTSASGETATQLAISKPPVRSVRPNSTVEATSPATSLDLLTPSHGQTNKMGVAALTLHFPYKNLVQSEDASPSTPPSLFGVPLTSSSSPTLMTSPPTRSKIASTNLTSRMHDDQDSATKVSTRPLPHAPPISQSGSATTYSPSLAANTSANPSFVFGTKTSPSSSKFTMTVPPPQRSGLSHKPSQSGVNLHKPHVSLAKIVQDCMPPPSLVQSASTTQKVGPNFPTSEAASTQYLNFPDPATVSEDSLKKHIKDWSERLASPPHESLVEETLIFSRFVWDVRDSLAAKGVMRRSSCQSTFNAETKET